MRRLTELSSESSREYVKRGIGTVEELLDVQGPHGHRLSLHMALFHFPQPETLEGRQFETVNGREGRHRYLRRRGGVIGGLRGESSNARGRQGPEFPC